MTSEADREKAAKEDAELEELLKKRRAGEEYDQQRYQELLKSQMTQGRSSENTFSVEGETAKIIESYMELKFNEGKEPPEPQSDGSLRLKFPSRKHALNFFQDLAGKNMKFMVCNGKTGKVMAYSDGSGTLFHGDGTAFKKGDVLKDSSIDQKDFDTSKVMKGTAPTPG